MDSLIRIRLQYIDLFAFPKNAKIDTFRNLPDVTIPFVDVESKQVIEVPFLIVYRRVNGKAHASMSTRHFAAMLAAELNHLTADKDFIATWGQLEVQEFSLLRPILGVIGSDGIARPPCNIFYRRLSQGVARNRLNLHLSHNAEFTTKMSSPDEEFSFGSSNPCGELRGQLRIFGYDDRWSISHPYMKLTGLFSKEEIERAVFETIRGTYPFLLNSQLRSFTVIDH